MSTLATKPEPEGVPDWRNDLLKDKSFWSVVAHSIGVVGSKTDSFVIILVLSIGAVGVLFARLCFGQLILPGETASIVQQWSSLCAGVCAAILGFLITGFAIFASVTNRTLFQFLAQFRQKGRNISEFKFVFYNFIYIFAHYILFLSVSMFFAIMFVKESPLWFVGELVHKQYPEVVDLGVSLAGLVVFTYAIFSLLLLRSFLWNLYQALLFAIIYDN